MNEATSPTSDVADLGANHGPLAGVRVIELSHILSAPTCGLMLADLGDRFTGAELLAGTAALTAMFGLGGIAGPTLGGAAMQHFGPEGLPALLAGAYGLLLVVSVIRGRR